MWAPNALPALSLALALFRPVAGQAPGLFAPIRSQACIQNDLRPFTVRAYHDGPGGPGNLTNYYLGFRNGKMVLHPSSDWTGRTTLPPPPPPEPPLVDPPHTSLQPRPSPRPSRTGSDSDIATTRPSASTLPIIPPPPSGNGTDGDTQPEQRCTTSNRDLYDPSPDAPEMAVLYMDTESYRVSTYSPWKQPLFVDSAGQLRYLRPHLESMPADSLVGPFFRIGRNPGMEVCRPPIPTEWTVPGYTNPGPSLLNAGSWTGTGFWACPDPDEPADSKTRTVSARLIPWLDYDADARCDWVWLIALDYSESIGPKVVDRYVV